MKVSKLPVLISIPHGGTVVPKEVREIFLLEEQEVLRDGDTWTREVFDFGEKVMALIDTETPRVVVDLNRGKTDLPPENFDGVVKTKSVFLNPVWKSPKGLDEKQRKILLAKYYDPYYAKISKALNNPEIKLGLDCHSMLPEDPFDQTAKKRPLFCISNRGGKEGEFINEKLSGPQELLLQFKELLEAEFGKGSVRLNDPFKGGYLTKHFGMQKNIPWIQLEVNRNLYLPAKGAITPVPKDEHCQRVKELNHKIYQGIQGLNL